MALASKTAVKGASLVARKAPRPLAKRAVRAVAERASNTVSRATKGVLSLSVDRVPIQRSIDVAVPIEVAYDEWMAFDCIPEGARHVEDVESDGNGRLFGCRGDDDWEAEIVEQRPDESFGWQSVNGSDVAGLVTFHALGERLTRVELSLDVVPGGVGEALSLLARTADRRAENDLRRFKARVEAIDPDDYPPLDEEEEDE